MKVQECQKCAIILSNKIENLEKSILCKNPFIYESFIERKIMKLEAERKGMETYVSENIEQERVRLAEKGIYLTDDGILIGLRMKDCCETENKKPSKSQRDIYAELRIVDTVYDPQEHDFVFEIKEGIKVIEFPKKQESPKETSCVERKV